ncbi:hypothetical protein A2U01_0103780, partial [Trifolium medium]|nr:hypothetical protein [Trifolium medium]
MNWRRKKRMRRVIGWGSRRENRK